MDHVAVQITLFVVITAGIVIMIVGIPGNFIAAVVALAYLIFSQEQTIKLWHFIVILLLALSGEGLEQLMGVFGAKKYGASKKGMMGAFIGAIAGGILGSLLLPVIGTIFGVFIGCFTCTFLFEYIFQKRNTDESVKAGVGALIGKVIALSYKYSVGFIILGIFVWRFWLS